MDSNTTIPEFVTTAAFIWSKAKEAATAYNNVLAQIQSAEAAARPTDTFWSLASSRIKEVSVSEFWDGILANLLREAVNRFSPPGTQIEIDVDELKANVPACKWEEGDPLALWLALESRYGKRQAEKGTYHSLAKRLVRAFRLNVNEVRTVAGRITLAHSVYWDKQFSGGYSYNSLEGIRSLLRDIQGVIHWAQLASPMEDEEFNRLIDYFNHLEKVVPPRQSIGSHVFLVPYQSKIEVRLSPEFGTQFQLFIGDYGAEELSDAA